MIIDHQLLNTLSTKAVKSVRKRMNYNFHQTPEDPLQRMLNVLNPGSYVQPHKHESPAKREAFIVLSGRLLVVLFDQEGNIKEHCVLNHSEGIYGIEIAPSTYHTIAALEPNTCVYEVKDGPYSPDDDKQFAPWAPAEDMHPESDNYLNELLDKTKKATLP